MHKFYNDKQIIPLEGKTPKWADWPHRNTPLAKRTDSGNWGWVVGADHLVVDVDPRNGGDVSLESLAREIQELQKPTVTTGSGGFHFYFRKPPDFRPRKLSGRYPGIELLHGPKQVVIPPSLHPKTLAPYEFANPPNDIHALPDALIAQITEHWGFMGESKTNIEPDHLFGVLDVADVPEILEGFPAAEYGQHDDWVAMVLGVHHMVGGNTDAIPHVLAWSETDPMYEGDPRVEPRIREIWDSARNTGSNVRTAYWFLHKTKKSYTTGAKKRLNNAAIEASINAFRDALASGDLTEDEAEKAIRENHKTKRCKRIGEGVFADWDTRKKPIADKRLEEVQGDVDLFLEKQGKVFEFYNRGACSQYKDNYWVPIGKYDATSAIRRFLKEHNISRHINQTDDMFKILRENASFMDPADAIETDIPARNCIIHIDQKTITTRAHGPHNKNTYVLPFDYDPTQTCPAFDTMLTQIWADLPDTEDMVRHFWEFVGYTIQPQKDIATVAFFVGPGHNGKSTLVNFIESLLGPDNVVKGDARSFMRDKFLKSMLVNKMLLVDDDMSSGVFLSASLLKEISEQKLISYDRKFEVPINGYIHLVPLFLTNNHVWLDDSSAGIQRRLQVFPFNNDVSKHGQELPNQARKETAGILNQALRGIRRLRERGGFDLPESLALTTREFFLSSNPVFLWLCSLPKGANIPKDGEGFTEYRAWASFRGFTTTYRVDYARFKEICSDYERIEKCTQ